MTLAEQITERIASAGADPDCFDVQSLAHHIGSQFTELVPVPWIPVQKWYWFLGLHCWSSQMQAQLTLVRRHERL